MNLVFASGIVLTAVGVAGYLAGTTVEYPGRAFSVTAVMIGVTLLAIGSANSPEGEPQ